MLHVPTLQFTLILMDVLIATLLWAAIGAGRRQGLVPWILSLGAQALMFAVMGLTTDDTRFGAIVTVNLLAALTLTLQAEAILRFFNRALPAWVHLAAPIAMIAVMMALRHSEPARLFVGCVVYGAALIALSVMTHRLRDTERGKGMQLLCAGYAVAGTVLFARAGVALLAPEGLIPHPWEAAAVCLFAFAITFATAAGFLHAHRQRHDHLIGHLALVDALTGIFNRRTFFNLASMALSQAQRGRYPVSLLLVDLDHFKRVNDAFGHQAGDAVLQRFVELVQAALRKEDIFARYGGEEFCVLVPNATPMQARTLADRIRESVEQGAFEFSGQWIQVTVSVGVATLHPAEVRIESLLRRADEALYVAKRDGRNRVVFA